MPPLPEVLDLYLILGCKVDSTTREIRAAYKTLVINFTPNDPQHNEDVFQAIKNAYAILSDPVKRATYDLDYPSIKKEWVRYLASDSGVKIGYALPKPKAKPRMRARAVRQETMAEDIGARYAVKMDDGREISEAEHARICGCRLSRSSHSEDEGKEEDTLDILERLDLQLEKRDEYDVAYEDGFAKGYAAGLAAAYNEDSEDSEDDSDDDD